MATEVLVPDCDDIEALLGTDADTGNLIVRVFCSRAEHGGNHVFVVDIARILATDAHRIGAAANVALVLPQGRKGVAHQEVETIKDGLVAKRIDKCPEFTECTYCCNLHVGARGPFLLIRAVIPEAPRTCRDRRVNFVRCCHFGDVLL